MALRWVCGGVAVFGWCLRLASLGKELFMLCTLNFLVGIYPGAAAMVCEQCWPISGGGRPMVELAMFVELSR
jgi:hypothetical protein